MVKARSKPLWGGPEKEGVTNSLLQRFLACRERFRVSVIEGLGPPETFNHRIEYGNMWHTCEEALEDWEDALRVYASNLASVYRDQQEQVAHWHMVCRTQFPIYLEYWMKHPEVVNQDPILREEVFAVPIRLPSGRSVILRGKWDGVSVIGKGGKGKLYLEEHKTRGDVDPAQIQKQLMFDHQTMIYVTALQAAIDQEDPDTSVGELPIFPKKRVAGIRYNVIRRPLSGGKHSIRRLKPTKSNPQGESAEAYYARLGGLIQEEPDHYFHRWTASVQPSDIVAFRTQYLEPILEQLCDWYHWVTNGDPWDKDRVGRHKTPDMVPRNIDCSIHWRTPYGLWSAITQGGQTDLDAYLDTGSTVGLERVRTLFPELGE